MKRRKMSQPQAKPRCALDVLCGKTSSDFFCKGDGELCFIVSMDKNHCEQCSVTSRSTYLS